MKAPGEIVAMGRNITKDTAGNPVALGDKIVTCIIPCGTCDVFYCCMFSANALFTSTDRMQRT